MSGLSLNCLIPWPIIWALCVSWRLCWQHQRTRKKTIQCSIHYIKHTTVPNRPMSKALNWNKKKTFQGNVNGILYDFLHQFRLGYVTKLESCNSIRLPTCIENCLGWKRKRQYNLATLKSKFRTVHALFIYKCKRKQTYQPKTNSC